MRDPAVVELPRLANAVVELRVVERRSPGNAEGAPAGYTFAVHRLDTGERVGQLSFRVDDDPAVTEYLGHIGVTIDKAQRGEGFGAQACRVARQVGAVHGLAEVWATAGVNNPASHRILELAGFEPVDSARVPQDTRLQQIYGVQVVRRFRASTGG